VTQKSDIAKFDITVDGQALGDDIRVVAVHCWHAINRIGWAELHLADSNDKNNTLPTTNDSSLEPGKSLEIKLGRGAATTTVFKGSITGSRLSIGGGDMHLVIEGRDDAYQMTLVPTTKVFQNQKDSEIASGILAGYSSLSASMIPTETEHDQVLQHQTTDWDFVLTRMSLQSQLISSCAGKVSSFKGTGTDCDKVKQTLDDTIIKFEAHTDSRRQKDSIDLMTWDLENQDTVTSSASTPDFEDQGSVKAKTLAAAASLSNSKVTLGSAGTVESEDATAQASAILFQSRVSKISCDIEIIGREDIFPGAVMTLSGFGDLYNGDVLVNEVEHYLEGGAWKTSIRTGVGRDWVMDKLINVGDNDRFPERLLSQLHLGKVTKISEDPDSMTRAQVLLPLVFGAEADPVWARVSSFSAGDSRGGFFMPNVGDEVLVGFVGANNLNPIIIGKLFSKNRKAPITPEDENNYVKGFYSDKNMKLEFNEEKPSLEVSTPGGAKILLDDDEGSVSLEDQNGNSLKMDSSGITIKSASDYNVTATSGNITEKGMSVSLSGSQSLEASGSTSAELTSTGTTKVQGTMVQIN